MSFEAIATDSLSISRTSQFLDEALFVMTVYKQSISNSKAWASLEACLSASGLHGALYIYDNSPIVQDVPPSMHLHQHYHHNGANPGVSAAYNTAWRFAQQQGKKWMLLLDQDTSFGAEAIARYVAAVEENPSCGLFAPLVTDSVGILSPFQFINGRSTRVSRMSSRFPSLTSFRVINAGLLVSCELFGKAGGYEEDIALDFSDAAFLEKVSPFCASICLVNTTLKQDFSGSAMLDRKKSIERFWKYSAGALAFARRFNRNELQWTALLRAIKLSLRFVNPRFLWIHYKTWSG